MDNNNNNNIRTSLRQRKANTLFPEKDYELLTKPEKTKLTKQLNREKKQKRKIYIEKK